MKKKEAAAILTELYPMLSGENYLHMVHFINSFVSEDEPKINICPRCQTDALYCRHSTVKVPKRRNKWLRI